MHDIMLKKVYRDQLQIYMTIFNQEDRRCINRNSDKQMARQAPSNRKKTFKDIDRHSATKYKDRQIDKTDIQRDRQKYKPFHRKKVKQTKTP